MPPQSPKIPPHVNPSVVDVVDDVDVVVDSSASVELVEVELLVVVVSSVVLVDDVIVDVLDVELVDEEVVAPGSVLLLVVGPAVVVVVVLVVEIRVVDGRLVVVVTVAGYGSGHAVGAAARRAAKRPGASFRTLPPKSAQ